jgi:hypothetical protein
MRDGEPNHDNIDWDRALPGTKYNLDTHTPDRTIKRSEKPVSWYVALSKGGIVIGTNTMTIRNERLDGVDIEYYKWQVVYVGESSGQNEWIGNF